MIRTLVAVLLLALAAPIAAARTVSLTFDDGLDPGKEPQARAWNDAILAGLRSADVKAMVFPSLLHTGGAEGRALVRDWAEAGHAVGNHTSKHRSLGSPRITLDAFIQHVQEADEAFRGLPTWTPRLRFPYLKEGETREKRDGMRAWMRENGYRPAPVSIDTSDWYFDQLHRAHAKAGDSAKLAALKAAYVKHLLDRAEYYDDLARRVIGRSPAHVLLMHVNALNAAALPDVIAAFTSRGWTIVAPAKAFEDPLYASEPDTLPAGESIVWAHARAKGIAGLRYPAEDSVYEEPGLKALGLVP